MLTTNYEINWLRYNSHVMSNHLDNLETVLKEAGVSQSELARRVGVSRGAVNHWVTGRTAISMEHLLKIAKVLNMSTSEILGDDVRFADNVQQLKTLDAMDQLSTEEQEQIQRMAELLAADSKKLTK